MDIINVPFTGYYDGHRKFHVGFTKGITTLIGKNGCGKTSMVRELEYWLKKENIPVYLYIQDDKGKDVHHSGFNGGSFAATSVYHCASEGERIIVTCGYMLSDIKRFIQKHTELGHDKIFVLFDGLDSGLSIDNIIQVREVFDLLIKDYPNLYIVNTANNYEMLKDTRCVHAKTGRDVKIKTYSGFVKFIAKAKAIAVHT